MANSYDITILQGATFKMTLTYKDATSTTLIGAGDSARMQIRAEKSQTSVLILDCTPYLSVSATSIILEIPHGITAGLSFVSGFYDIELIQGAVVRRICQGRAFLDAGVTV